MIKIDDKLVSDDLRTVRFVCDLSACKGACCVEGDAGAPLDEDELEIIERIYPAVRPYLSEKSQAVIEEKGTWIKVDGEYETPLINGRECAYVIEENGVSLCGIEKAHREGKVAWLKPISCHLYPVRIKQMRSIEIEAVNYDAWSICRPACANGQKLQVPVYKFLKAPLTRKFGEEFYRKLEDIFDNFEE